MEGPDLAETADETGATWCFLFVERRRQRLRGRDKNGPVACTVKTRNCWQNLLWMMIGYAERSEFSIVIHELQLCGVHADLAVRAMT